jgi:peptide/nickel transport system ATP-binding protein
VTTPGSDLLVKAVGVTVSLEGTPTHIIEDIDLTLQRGEVLGLVGESGSGKTTLALALLGYARRGSRITSGSVLIDGVEMIQTTESERRESRSRLVAYVPQDPAASLNPALRIKAQLSETLEATGAQQGVALKRLEEVLDKVQLPATSDFLRRYPHQLSGGQQQRVCIAMAISCNPRIIVFDEPTTGLDVTTQAHVLDTIRELIGAVGTSAVYVTHDLAVVTGLADRLAVIYAGRIAEEGPTRFITNRSAHPYSRRLLMATPSVHRRSRLLGIAGSPMSPRERSDSCSFAPRCEFAEKECMDRTPDLALVDMNHRSRCRRAAFVQLAPIQLSSGDDSTWREHVSHSEGALLDVQGLSAWYGRKLVLDHLDFSIAPGECLAMVGESGSGKTTLARCLGGLHLNAIGRIRFQGEELLLRAAKRSIDSRRRIQYIFQNPFGSLNPRQTVGQLVALPLDVFDLGNKAARATYVRSLLERVAVNPEYESRFPDQLSGGERQRVAIARALAAEPRLLICDEITSSLDVSIQASILDLLGQLRRDMDLTLVFITHNLAVVRSIADRVVIIREGAFLEQGTTSHILDSPENEYTQRLLANAPALDTPYAQIGTDYPPAVETLKEKSQ